MIPTTHSANELLEVGMFWDPGHTVELTKTPGPVKVHPKNA